MTSQASYQHVYKEGKRNERKKEAKKAEIRKDQENADIDIGYPRPVSGCLRSEDFFSGSFDPVDLAICVTNGTRKDRALWRKYMRNGSIDECVFLECVFRQWRENCSDGMPDNPAACLQLKFNAHLKGGVA